jgi:hypothetical protein
MTFLSELTSQQIAVISGRVLESVDDQEQYFLTFTEVEEDESEDELISIRLIPVRTSSIWEILVDPKPFTSWRREFDLLAGLPKSLNYHWDNTLAEINREKFQRLAAEWRRTRSQVSSAAWENVLNPSCKKIIWMGLGAIPLILSELSNMAKTGQHEHGDWFTALGEITETNPVPEESRGDVKAMTKAWLDWGRQHGYLHGESLGAVISAAW